MIIDGTTVSADAVLRPRVCIVGAGPASQALGAELIACPFDVLIIESGQRQPDSRTQALSELEPTGLDFEPGPDSRRRALGGTAHVWNTFIRGNHPAARFLPLDEVDFEQRDWFAHSGWPFTRAHLDPFYERAARIAGVPNYPVLNIPGTKALNLDPSTLTTTIEHFSTADVFTQQLPAKLEQAPNISILLGATVTRLGAEAGGKRIEFLEARTMNGGSVKVEADVVVLAAGGIENPRLMLASDDVVNTGIGNARDLVGRFFMDHHRIAGGVLVPFRKELFRELSLYDLRGSDQGWTMGKITLAQEALRREQLMNVSTLLWPRPSAELDQAVDSMHELRRGHIQRQHVLRATKGLPYLIGTGVPLMLRQRTLQPNISRGGWSRLPRNERRFEVADLVHQVEQTPHSDNRVVLGVERDELGMRRARVFSRWSGLDLVGLERVWTVLEDQLAQAAIGRIEGGVREAGLVLHQSGGMHHHMGTTRMHVDPAQGVVDADLRVHGMHNLYVAGSSVFPTGGYANPTLTLLALSVRLADHLKERMTRDSQPLRVAEAIA